MKGQWKVELSGKARKSHKTLSLIVLKALKKLTEDLKNGPEVYQWPNYGKLGPCTYHCHLKKGRPTYVACWTADKKNKIIEVYYAGTHEKAPY